MSNILKAFINTIKSYQSNVSTMTNGNNRANNMGAGLEEFIKDIFAGTINETNEQNRLTTFSQTHVLMFLQLKLLMELKHLCSASLCILNRT